MKWTGNILIVLLCLVSVTVPAREYKKGEYIYLKNHIPEGWSIGYWVLPPSVSAPNPCAWVRLYDKGHKLLYEKLMELHYGAPGSDTAVYRAKIDSIVASVDHIVFTRNYDIGTTPLHYLWNYTKHLSVVNTDYNLYDKINGTDGECCATYKGSYYVTKLDYCVLSLTNTPVGGSGSKADPYQFQVSDTLLFVVKSFCPDAGVTGYGWNINESSVPKDYTNDAVWAQASVLSSTSKTIEAWTGFVWSYFGEEKVLSEYVSSDTIYTVTIPACNDSLVYIKWSDFLFADATLGDFVSYQWYRYGEPIDGETGQSLFLHYIDNAEYSVNAYTADGEYVKSCSHRRTDFDHSVDKGVGTLHIVPNPALKGSVVCFPAPDNVTAGTVVVYDNCGQMVLSKPMAKGDNCFTVTVSGTYIVTIYNIGGVVVKKSKLIVK